MIVAPKVGNLPSKFRHAFEVSNYSLCTRRTERQTDGLRTDGQKQRLLPLPYGRNHNKHVMETLIGGVRYEFELLTFFDI